MGNTLLTPSVIANEAIVALRKNCVMAQLVHRDYSAEFIAKVGDTITVRKPATFVANEYVQGSGITVQDGVEGSVSVKMDKLLDVSFAVTTKEMSLDIKDFGTQFLDPALAAFAEKIDGYLTGLYADVPFYAAISGTPAIGDFSAMLKILNDNKAPFANRNIVFGTAAHAAFVVMEQFANADKAGSTEALRNANAGRIFGLDSYVDQSIATHVNGTLGTAKVKTGVAAGASSGTLYNTSLTGTLKAGDLFKIAGDTTTYVITKNATAAANEIAIEFYPAAAVSWASDAAVTMVTAGEVSLAFHKNAFALVTRQLELPLGTDKAAIVNYDGFAIRVVEAYDITNKKDVISLDMLCGVKTLTPELACRLIK